MERVKTGIEGLDHMLKGGLIRGREVLLSGPCGTGKTTIGMQFIYSGVMDYGEEGLFITLEESKRKIYDDMKSLGFDLDKAEKTGKFHLIGGPIASVTDYMEKADADVGHIINEIKEVVRARNIKRVVIDSVTLLTMFAKSDDERRRVLASLCNILSAMNCTSLLISEVKENTTDISRHGIEEFVVDGVIVLHLIREGSKFVPGISIRKLRGSDHDREIRMYEITGKGVVVYQDETMFTNL
jgi:KaiC/GvpD/RAD55 family RecA-like ATPase